MSGVGDSPSDDLFAFQVIYAADEETIIKDCLHLVL
jgi:hypothetical protein